MDSSGSFPDVRSAYRSQQPQRACNKTNDCKTEKSIFRMPYTTVDLAYFHASATFNTSYFAWNHRIQPISKQSGIPQTANRHCSPTELSSANDRWILRRKPHPLASTKLSVLIICRRFTNNEVFVSHGLIQRPAKSRKLPNFQTSYRLLGTFPN